MEIWKFEMDRTLLGTRGKTISWVTARVGPKLKIFILSILMKFKVYMYSGVYRNNFWGGLY